MKDNTYKILLKLSKTPLCSAEIAKYNNILSSIHILVSNKYIAQYTDVYGEPIDSFYITDTGIEYIRSVQKERSGFIKSFFSQFISGFLVGVLSTILATIILQCLL
jgi:hypothetical protein